MGEVYLATDSQLGRKVAVKVLPEAFASDAQRMARFEREAQLLAALNHTNIATVYGLERAGGTRALVMELVEGPTLAERIAQGPVPLEDALGIARQIAEALEYAHERGIIHRDLKPANIKLTTDGKVKLLDFGLAKALDDSPAAQDVSNSPTISAMATRAGVILGTAAYMSPEQAKGAAVDRRTDIWAFGVVLYEMLCGKAPYTDKSVQETLARVLKEDPSWNALPAETPRAVRRLLERCLRKDPKQRLRDVGDARLAIDEHLAHPAEEAATAAPSDAGQAPAATPLWRRALPWGGMAVFAAAAVLGFWRPWSRVTGPGERIALRLNSDIGVEGTLVMETGSSEALSPDGSRIVYAVTDASGKQQLYLRSLDQLQATVLAGTEGGRDPFFSPDGEWIAFFTGEKLKKISVHGGAVVTLCDATPGRGGTWSEDGTILFAGSIHGGLLKVDSAGGTPEAATALDSAAGEITHRWPQMLPGTRAVLFTAGHNLSSLEQSNLEVQVLPSGPRKTVYRGGYYGRYLPSGHVAFIHEGTLFALPFDLKRMEPAGQAVPVLEHVMSNPDTGGAQFSISENGALAYVQGIQSGVPVSIEWMGRDGKMQPLLKTPGEFYTMDFSPDGKRLAMEIQDGPRRDIWTYDLQRDTLTRLTFGGVSNFGTVWTPDGQRITYAMSEASGTINVYWKRADGAGDAQRLTDSKDQQFPSSWSPDGKVLAMHVQPADSRMYLALYTMTMQGDEKSGWKPGEPKLFAEGPGVHCCPKFSPDGRWIAYQSNESGRSEIYVRPFPGPGGKWQISSDGGVYPAWSATSKELFFENNRQQMMVVPYSATADSFQAGKPALWSEGQFTDRGVSWNFALHPDGKRFAVLKAPAAEAQQRFNKVVFVSDFSAELRRQVPVKP